MKKPIYLLFLFSCSLHLSAQYGNYGYDVLGYDGNDIGVAIQYDPDVDGWLVGVSGFWACPSPIKGCWALIQVDSNHQQQLIFKHVFPDKSTVMLHQGEIFKTPANDAYVVASSTSNGGPPLRPMFTVIHNENDYEDFELPIIYEEYKFRQVLRGPKGGYLGICDIYHEEDAFVGLVAVDSSFQVQQVIELKDTISRFEQNSDLALAHDGGILYAHTFFDSPWGEEELIVGKLDSNFQESWRKRMSKSWINNGQPILVPHPDGRITLYNQVDSAILNSATDYWIGPHPGLYGLDAEGNIEWLHLFLVNQIAEVYSIKRAANGDIIGCGYDALQDFHLPGYANKPKAWLFRVSPEGEVKWSRYFLDPEYYATTGFFFVDLAEAPDGRIAAVGTRVTQYDNGFEHTDVWLLEVDSNGCYTPDCTEDWVLVDTDEPVGPDMDQPPAAFSVFPNPIESALQLYLTAVPEVDRIRMELLDLSGRVVEQWQLPNQTASHSFDVSAYPPGIYVLIARGDRGQWLGTQRVVKH